VAAATTVVTITAAVNRSHKGRASRVTLAAPSTPGAVTLAKTVPAPAATPARNKKAVTDAATGGGRGGKKTRACAVAPEAEQSPAAAATAGCTVAQLQQRCGQLEAALEAARSEARRHQEALVRLEERHRTARTIVALLSRSIVPSTKP